MPKKNYTIKDIAVLAGVSKGTVDRVIHKRGSVSKKALDAVNTVLEDIDFKPNVIARRLKQNKHYTIGVILPDPNKDPYWLPCLDAISTINDKYNALGIHTELFYYSPKFTNSFLKTCIKASNAKLDAVLLSPLFYKQTLKIIDQFKAQNILISTFNDPINSKLITNYVGQDLFKSGRVAGHLMSTLTSKNSSYTVIHIDEAPNNAIHMQDKEKGFKDYFTTTSTTVETLKLSSKTIEADLLKYLTKPTQTDGVFITTSKAHLVVNVLSKHNFNTIKVIGYDLLEDNIKYLKLGKIDYLIHQNPKEQVVRALSTLSDYFLLNSPILQTQLLPIDIISCENLDSYLTH